MIAALGHDIVAIDERDGVVPQVLESLPRHDHAPRAPPWLHRIIGVLRRCGPTIRRRHNVILAVVTRRHQQAQSELRVVRACLFTLRAAAANTARRN